METTFTPFASLAGGAMIGLAAVLLMLLRGRILGATGILSGALRPSDPQDWTWRVLMLTGMLCGPWIYFAAVGTLPAIDVPVSTGPLLLGGVLVGIGVTLGNGCTSGHGVCGLARLSPRSMSATVTFMIATGLTVYVLRHMLGV